MQRRELVLEGQWHFPLKLFDLQAFREWRHSRRFPEGIKASYLEGMVYIETDLDRSMRRGNGHKLENELSYGPENETCFCIDGWLCVPPSAFELEGFRDWIHSAGFPHGVKATFIGGSLEVETSPEELESHAKLKVELVGELRRLSKRHALGDLFCDSTTVVWPPAGLSTEPDLVFCSWESYRSGRVRESERKEGSNRFVELVGAPDLVVEVVSDSSVSKDKRRLRRTYWQTGIPEYWIVDARGQGHVRFQLLTRGETGYDAVAPDDAGFRLSPTFGRRFRIVRRTNPVGRYDYRLLQRKHAGP
ncbi:MAG TPA: Uma2 family endonuclease [Pirellulales bacterium]|nr:Uma2 family endonuclease [Pirellulales bacterium]